MSRFLPQKFCVRWHNHKKNFGVVIPQLLTGQCFADVTLVCQGNQFPCHRLVLAAHSNYFKRLLSDNPSKHPIIILSEDFRLWEIQALIDFMYKGEVIVYQTDLSEILKCAKTLQIRGLCDNKVTVDKINSTIQTQSLSPNTLATTTMSGTTTAITYPTPTPKTTIRDSTASTKIKPISSLVTITVNKNDNVSQPKIIPRGTVRVKSFANLLESNIDKSSDNIQLSETPKTVEMSSTEHASLSTSSRFTSVDNTNNEFYGITENNTDYAIHNETYSNDFNNFTEFTEDDNVIQVVDNDEGEDVKYFIIEVDDGYEEQNCTTNESNQQCSDDLLDYDTCPSPAQTITVASPSVLAAHLLSSISPISCASTTNVRNNSFNTSNMLAKLKHSNTTATVVEPKMQRSCLSNDYIMTTSVLDTIDPFDDDNMIGTHNGTSVKRNCSSATFTDKYIKSYNNESAKMMKSLQQNQLNIDSENIEATGSNTQNKIIIGGQLKNNIKSYNFMKPTIVKPHASNSQITNPTVINPQIIHRISNYSNSRIQNAKMAGSIVGNKRKSHQIPIQNKNDYFNRNNNKKNNPKSDNNYAYNRPLSPSDVVLRHPRGNQPRSYNTENLYDALMAVKTGQSIYSASQIHNVPRKTLRNWMKRWNIKSIYPMPLHLKQATEGRTKNYKFLNEKINSVTSLDSIKVEETLNLN